MQHWLCPCYGDDNPVYLLAAPFDPLALGLYAFFLAKQLYCAVNVAVTESFSKF